MHAPTPYRPSRKRVVGYRYDANGNLTGVTPPARPAHGYAYTPAGLVEVYAPPALGEETSTRMEYNADRQPIRLHRPDGVVVETEYDAGGRRASVALPGDTLRFAYDGATGQLRGVTRTAGASLGYAYDGQLLKAVAWTGAVAGRVELGYDSDFRVAAQKVNGADSVAFRYDADGLLTGAGALTFTRDPQNGLPTGTTLGGVTTTQAFTEYGERRSLRAAYNGATLFSTTYTRDAAGRIETLTETIGGATTTHAYAYDAAGRLKEVRRDGAVAAAYEYDANGNRTRVTTPAGVVEASADAQDRLTRHGEATYGYTAAGELAWRAEGADTTRYRYDALGNLREVGLPTGTRIEYVVDAENRRVGRKVDGRLVQGWLWEGALRPVAELDSAGAVVARFVYGERPNVPEYMVRGGRTYRLVHDHLGSVRLVVDVVTGEVAQRIDYDAFGRVEQDTRPGFQPFGYAGGLYDERSGLLRFGARDYDPSSGRWTARDPIGFDGGDSNLYGYVLQDPVNAHDPEGTALLLTELRAQTDLREAEVASARLTINIFRNTFTRVTPQAPQNVLRWINGDVVHGHHVFPQSRKLASHFYQRFGIHVDDYILNIPKRLHIQSPYGIHTGPFGQSWNGVWQHWLNTADKGDEMIDAYIFARAMVAEFGIAAFLL